MASKLKKKQQLKHREHLKQQVAGRTFFFNINFLSELEMSTTFPFGKS